MKSFSYTELDKLTGEVLPERAVLSTLLTGGGHGSANDNENANFNLGGGDNGGTTAVVPLCQSTVSNQGGLAGILAAANNSSFTCASAAVASGH